MSEINFEELLGLTVFSSEDEIVNYLLLKYLLTMNKPVRSRVFKSMFDNQTINIGTEKIGQHLDRLDAKGYTEFIENKGRVITLKGADHVNKLSEKVRKELLQKQVINAAHPQNLKELIDLMKARKALECEAARLAALRANDNNVKDLDCTVAMHESCVNNFKDPTVPALDFHEKVAEASNIRFLIATIDIVMNEELKLDSRFLEITKERASEYVQHHRLIANAIKDGDAEEAEKQMGIHMDSMINALEKLIEA